MQLEIAGSLAVLCGILWQVLFVHLGIALLWAAVAEFWDLLQPTHIWDVLLLLSYSACSPAVPLASAAVQAVGQGVRCGCRCCGLWCVYDEEMVQSVPNSLTLISDIPPWNYFYCCLLLSCHQWLLWVARGTCKKLKSEKYKKTAVSEGWKSCNPYIACLLLIHLVWISLDVLFVLLSAEVYLQQWSYYSCHLFHEEWQNTIKIGNCFAILGFQGICLHFTSWCPSGSVGKLTPFTIWVLVIRILIHS